MIGTFLYTSYYFVSIPVLILVFVNTFAKKRTDRLQNRIFINIGVNLLITAILGMIWFAVLPYRLDNPILSLITMAYDYLYYALHSSLPVLFCIYVMSVNGTLNRKDKVKTVIFFIPLAIAEYVIFTNPFTDSVWYYDESLTFQRGPLEMLLYAEAGLYMLILFFTLFKNAYALSKKRLKSLCFYLLVAVVGVVIQLLFKEIRCETFFETIALFGIMLVIENEDERIDVVTGVYNRSALIQEIGNRMTQQSRFGVICIRLTNVDVLSRMLGAQAYDDLIVFATDYLKKIYPWYRIYRATPADFILLTDEDDLVPVSEKVCTDFIGRRVIVREEAALNARLMRARVPEELKTIDDIFLMADGDFAYDEHGIVSGERLGMLTRSTDLENSLKRGLDEGRFRVVYQSIHKKSDLSLYALKALVRLDDEKLGEVLPDEFIPIAEKNGCIHGIGKFVLEDVCSFLAGGEPESIGVKQIHVNLAFVQCLNPDFAESVLEITGRYGVDPEMITFEITKPLTRSEFKTLDNVINYLKSKGFNFAMEDFGSGYANVESIFALDFDLVKTDKSLLWNAEKSEGGEIILGNSIRIIKDLKRMALVEGVETKTQLELINELNADLLQGFYFSKPMSGEAIIKHLKR